MWLTESLTHKVNMRLIYDYCGYCNSSLVMITTIRIQLCAIKAIGMYKSWVPISYND